MNEFIIIHLDRHGEDDQEIALLSEVGHHRIIIMDLDELFPVI